MIDVKKLITGFLILATAGGLSALITSRANTNANAQTADISATGTPAMGSNAFLAQSAAIDPALASTTEAIANDPDNLTNILTSNYLDGLMAANPDGAQHDANGNVSLAPPDVNAIINQFQSSSTTATIQAPDWDVEALKVPVTLIADSANAKKDYATAVQDILSKQFVATNAQSMLQTRDPNASSYMSDKVQTALQDIAGLQVPSSEKNLQKSLVRLLVYEKNMLSLATATSSDPLKTGLIFQIESQRYATAIQNFQTELQKTPIQNLSANLPEENQNGIVAFINTALGIHTAHAQWLTFDAANLAQMILDYARDIILQTLKNVIIAEMQQHVMKWVQGNGVPRFIQDWGATLINAYEQTALNSIDSQFKCVNNAPFAEQIQITLKALYKPPSAGSNVCAVQFNSQLANNLTKFYDNFSNGGWLTFGSTLEPDNNYYGSLFFQAQAVGLSAENAKRAAEAKAVANQGFTGSGVCSGGEKPDRNGQCANGEEIVTSPGKVTEQVFGSAVNSGSNLVTAANNIVGLFNAFLSSLLNSLASDAISAATGAVTSIGTGGSTNNSSAIGSSITATTPLSCTTGRNIGTAGGNTATFQPNLVVFTATGGETIDANGNLIPAQYSWEAPSGTPSTGSSQNLTVSYNATGTFTATVTNLNNSTSQTCFVTIDTLQ
jgi:hypothetical protein